ncbi:MAG TPA: hypothetical protein VL503_04055 [Candidatus Omnitrophota bacterium]|nr:hypothetical protein [Candidatus Omnitrophota bacterium]
MSRFGRCANSRAFCAGTRRRLGPAPIRIATPLFVCVLAGAAGCSSSPASLEGRTARQAAERYFAALAAHDDGVARCLASCRAGGPAFRGATVLRVGGLESVSVRTLDSLAAASGDEERRAALEFAEAGEETADSLWIRADAAFRRARMFGDAVRAAGMSRTGGADSILRVCRIRVRVRWAGPLVGPEPVDREHVLRTMAASGGRWIVFSLLPRDRDPWAALFGPRRI